ncbi:pyridoxal phosphate-dependent aminotransferase [Halalkalibacillus halophilus]|uniref:pyridoxal phosphate-dependent aminotransferase n=1 Tax=Halalkalibacillus halophilus TaxID=392827 RepID=UPI00041D82E2|nr:pyridoxal phosphate-dependent aminotransferase [Halalkalibacillus halophilus]
MEFRPSQMLERLPEQFFAELVRKTMQLKNEGHDVINLGQGNPDQPTPNHIIDSLQKSAENPLNHKYSPFRGQQELKEAVATFYKRNYDVDLDPTHEVAVLFGSKTGLVEISQCLLNPGDLALLPDPGYPDYLSGIALAGARPSFMPLLEKNNFLPDYEVIGKASLSQAKLMYLNYPNNPTSAVASESFFDETVSVAKEHNLAVVHDFAYGAVGFDSSQPTSFLQAEGAKEVGVETYTLSKTYNMAGWRVGFAVGNPSIIEHINLLQDHLYVSLFGAIQEAAKEALLGDQSPVTDLLNLYEERRNTFVHAANKIGWKVDAPKGTFFCWLSIPPSYTSEEFADLLLKEAHVVVAPGNGFGQYGEGYVRIGLLETPERLEEAIKRIEKLNLF